jgi:hypothetical protein
MSPDALRTEILAAPVAPTEAVDSTPTGRPGSNTSYIAALDIGRSFIYNAEVPGMIPLSDAAQVVATTKGKVRDNINAAVSRASKLTKNRYSTNVDSAMIAGRLFVVALVTRIE